MNNIQFNQEAYSNLSAREIDIARASIEGLTVKEIGHRLGIKPSTICTFRLRITNKLGCGTFIEAVAQI